MYAQHNYYVYVPMLYIWPCRAHRCGNRWMVNIDIFNYGSVAAVCVCVRVCSVVNILAQWQTGRNGWHLTVSREIRVNSNQSHTNTINTANSIPIDLIPLYWIIYRCVLCYRQIFVVLPKQPNRPDYPSYMLTRVCVCIRLCAKTSNKNLPLRFHKICP